MPSKKPSPKAAKKAGAATKAPVARQAVIYARVSSKEQEDEGFSIPSQLKLLREYARKSVFRRISRTQWIPWIPMDTRTFQDGYPIELFIK